ncbi:MAG: DUF2934 domain-containing protein [Candidatus Omnitrophota bacterium]
MAFKSSTKRTTTTTTATKKLSQDQLFNETVELAYQYYVDRGYQNGNDMEDWLKAEKAIRAKYNVK